MAIRVAAHTANRISQPTAVPTRRAVGDEDPSGGQR
jgi:hypothetical protein